MLYRTFLITLLEINKTYIHDQANSALAPSHKKEREREREKTYNVNGQKLSVGYILDTEI